MSEYAEYEISFQNVSKENRKWLEELIDGSFGGDKSFHHFEDGTTDVSIFGYGAPGAKGDIKEAIDNDLKAREISGQVDAKYIEAGVNDYFSIGAEGEDE